MSDEVAVRHMRHYRTCGCLGDSATCCDITCCAPFERLSLSSDRQDAADASQDALSAFLSAWDDSWGYGGRLTTSRAPAGHTGSEEGK